MSVLPLLFFRWTRQCAQGFFKPRTKGTLSPQVQHERLFAGGLILFVQSLFISTLIIEGLSNKSYERWLKCLLTQTLERNSISISPP